MGVFDKFRYVNTQKIEYRYFKNRTAQQTKFFTWGMFIAVGVIGWVSLGAFEKSSNSRLEVFKSYGRLPNDEIGMQTAAYRNLTTQAIRRSIGLKDRNPGNIEIYDPDDKNINKSPRN